MSKVTLLATLLIVCLAQLFLDRSNNPGVPRGALATLYLTTLLIDFSDHALIKTKLYILLLILVIFDRTVMSDATATTYYFFDACFVGVSRFI